MGRGSYCENASRQLIGIERKTNELVTCSGNKMCCGRGWGSSAWINKAAFQSFNTPRFAFRHLVVGLSDTRRRGELRWRVRGELLTLVTLQAVAIKKNKMFITVFGGVGNEPRSFNQTWAEID